MQLFLYIVTGASVTCLDILLYNVFSSGPLKLKRILAHLYATALSMTAGFSMHFLFVFQPSDPLVFERMLRYVLTICFSAYVLQTSIIYYLSLRLAVHTNLPAALARIGVMTGIPVECCACNYTKLCAVAAATAVNYVAFKFFVYN